MEVGLGAVVDTLVSADLRALSVAELQEQYVAAAPQVQRLSGFSGAVLDELSSRTGGGAPDAGRPVPADPGLGR